MEIVFGGRPGTKAHDSFHIAHGKRQIKEGKYSQKDKKAFVEKVKSLGREKELEGIKEHLHPYWSQS